VNPDSGLKRLPCGFSQPASLVYERLPVDDAMPRNFFFEPRSDAVYLRAVALDAAPQFDVEAVETWGAFTQPMDSLALVPGGYVVGVNRLNHKIEILELPAAATNLDTAPRSTRFAVQKMGKGTRAGLLGSPVAVAVFGNTILILEDGNKRIQAVDVSGNPVLFFQGGTASTLSLVAEPTQVFLDLAVEGLGFIYVLSYVANGLTAQSYRLEVYDPNETDADRIPLISQSGVAAARLEVDTFRNLYTLNYESVAGAPRTEPSLSQWEPSSPHCG